MKKLRKGLTRKPIHGTILGVEYVPCTRQVQVFNTGGITADPLCLYFENTRRSGGSGQVDVNLDQDKGYAIVTFESHTSKCKTTCRNYFDQCKALQHSDKRKILHALCISLKQFKISHFGLKPV